MRERAPESGTRSVSGISARAKPTARQGRAPARWRKPLLALLAALLTAHVQRMFTGPAARQPLHGREGGLCAATTAWCGTTEAFLNACTH